MLTMSMPYGGGDMPIALQELDIISIALWIPFALVMLIAGLIFAISGYKKGLWRALIGFAATIVAAVLSMWLSNLISKALAPTVVGLIPADMISPEGGMAGIASIVIQAAVQYVIALVLFSGLMFILTIILRAIGNGVTKKWKPKNGFLKLGGMLVGLVCALTYTLLLLMPLYGTLATYAPVVEDVIAISAGTEQENSLSAYIGAITKHPVVLMSGSAPIAAVYNTTTQVAIGENGTLAVADIAQTTQQAMEKLQMIEQADASQREQLCYDFILYLRQNFVEEPWAYDLTMEAVATLEDMLAQEPIDGPSALVIDDLLALLDISREEFQVNMTAILDFALYALEHDGYNILMHEDFAALYNSDIVLEAGKLANVTDQAVAVKNLLWSQYAFRLCGEDSQKIQAFLEKYTLPKLTDPKQLQQEAHALMLSMGFNGKSTPAEFVLAHPTLGEKVFNELVETYGFAAVIGIEDPDLAQQINSSTKLQQQYMQMLQQIVANPLNNTSMSDQLDTVQGLRDLIRDGYWWNYYDISPATLSNALAVVGKDAFTASGAMLSGGSYFYEFLSAYTKLDTNIYDPISMQLLDGADAMWQLIHMINKGQVPTSMDDYYEAVSRGEEVYCLSSALMSDGVVAAMKHLNGTKGSDPLGLGKKLSSSQKRFIQDFLDEQISLVNSGSQNGGYTFSGSSSSDVRYEYAVGGEDNSYTVNMEDVYGIIMNPDGTFQLPEGIEGNVTIIDGNMGYIAGDGNMIIIPGEGGSFIGGDMGGYWGSAYYYDSTYFSIEERAQIILKFFGI